MSIQCERAQYKQILRYPPASSRLMRIRYVALRSDSPQFFMTPGYAALREIDALVGAGLSPYAALEAATRNPAEYLGWNDIGTVATGKRADLLLLDANPLTTAANLQKVAGVMVDGRWLDAQRLSAIRDASRAQPAR